MALNIAVNTDFNGDTGTPSSHLKAIAEAGFTHLMWCHHWNTDFIYTAPEIKQIKLWLKEYGLKLQDIHSSVGPEKNWYSTTEYQREAGVELVANRMKMLRELDGTGVVDMHVPAIGFHCTPVEMPLINKYTDSLRRSLDALMPLAMELNVPIALENCPRDNFEILETMFREYPPEWLGLCYDCGHGHLFHNRGLDQLEKNKERLLALHIHDNDGIRDLHQPPFYGTLDWERFADILKRSPYSREICFEISVSNTPYAENIDAFFKDAYERCMKFTRMARA